MKHLFIFLSIFLCLCSSSISATQQPLDRVMPPESPPSTWPSLPGFSKNSPLVLNSQETFFVVFGSAIASYLISEFWLNDEENLNFYQMRLGINNHENEHVFLQNFGVENRVSSWFAFAVELNFQEWRNQNAWLDAEEQSGFGMGIMTYYRWYIFGRYRLSAYIEYGTGLFFGFENFPYNGTSFTFNHSTQLGLEYTFKDKHKLRLSYGQFHQSNNRLVLPNPGYDANGLHIQFSWYWKTSRF